MLVFHDLPRSHYAIGGKKGNCGNVLHYGQLTCLGRLLLYNHYVFCMNPVSFSTLANAMDFVVGDRNYPLSELFMKGGFIMWPLLLLSIGNQYLNNLFHSK